MAEIRETLRFGSTDLEELNRVMGRLQDRLDQLEGFRGTPAFWSDVDLQQRSITNVANLQTESQTVDQITITAPPNIPIISKSTVPTVADVPNSGDIAIWKYVPGYYYIVVNCEGTIKRTDVLT